MYLYMCICKNIYMYICIYMYKCRYVYICKKVKTYICKYEYQNVDTRLYEKTYVNRTVNIQKERFK